MCTCQLQSLEFNVDFLCNPPIVASLEILSVDWLITGVKEIKMRVQHMHLSASVAWNSKSVFHDFQKFLWFEPGNWF